MKYVVILRVNNEILEVWRCKTKARYLQIQKIYKEMAREFENASIDTKVEG